MLKLIIVLGTIVLTISFCDKKIKGIHSKIAQKGVQPMVCHLNQAGKVIRNNKIRENTFKSLVQTKELPNGYAYSFPKTKAMQKQLMQFIKLEQECCGFLTFHLNELDKSLQLDITGPEGIKKHLKEMGKSFLATLK